MKRQKNRKQGLFDRIGSLLMKSELPQRPPSGYRIELFGRKTQARTLISGATRILICTHEQVVLEVGEKKLSFSGEGLECLCYEGGIAEISGDIKGFSFLGGECV